MLSCGLRDDSGDCLTHSPYTDNVGRRASAYHQSFMWIDLICKNPHAISGSVLFLHSLDCLVSMDKYIIYMLIINTWRIYFNIINTISILFIRYTEHKAMAYVNATHTVYVRVNGKTRGCKQQIRLRDCVVRTVINVCKQFSTGMNYDSSFVFRGVRLRDMCGGFPFIPYRGLVFGRYSCFILGAF